MDNIFRFKTTVFLNIHTYIYVCIYLRGVTIHSAHETRRDTILGSRERDDTRFQENYHDKIYDWTNRLLLNRACNSLHAWCKHELSINFFFHKLKLNCRGVRHYFHTMLAYCPCLISHSTAIYHFVRLPKMLPNKRFESGGGIFNGNTGISKPFWLLAASPPSPPLLL